ncbi:MAG: hypothetical protein QME92_08995 [Bacillota bacterium]|nr:hypothetical protein [Bacillota bacterium]
MRCPERRIDLQGQRTVGPAGQKDKAKQIAVEGRLAAETVEGAKILREGDPV